MVECKSRGAYLMGVTNYGNYSIEETAKLEKELQEIDIVYATEKQKMVAIEENISRLEQSRDKLKQENTSLKKN